MTKPQVVESRKEAVRQEQRIEEFVEEALETLGRVPWEGNAAGK